MNWIDILTPEHVTVSSEATNKKQAFELLTSLTCKDRKKLSDHMQLVFHALIERERIGNTYIDHQIAIPHARVSIIKKPIVTLLKLTNPIPYGNNEEPVDLIFGLVVPEKATEEHLQLLSQIVEKLRNASYRESLRKAETADALYEMAIQ